MAGRALAIEQQEFNIIMAAGDTNKILSAIDGWRRENGEALATLKAEMGYVSRDVNALAVKVDRMEESKVGHKEVEAIETRLNRSVADVKAGAAFEAGRLTQDLTSRLDSAADELHDFRESVAAQFKELRDKVDSHEGIRNRVIGAWAVSGAVGAVIWAVIGWAVQYFSKKPG